MDKRSQKAGYQELLEWRGTLGLPNFKAFGDKDFNPAFEIAFQKTNKAIEKLAADQEKPSIENFLIPFELITKTLDRVCAVFFCMLAFMLLHKFSLWKGKYLRNSRVSSLS